MSTWVVWLLSGLGVAAVVARRRSVTVFLVTAQMLGVGVAAAALAPGRSAEFALAAGILCAKAVLVAPVLAAGVSRTRQLRPVRDETSPLLRLAATVALVLAVVGLMPAFGLEPAAAEDGAMAMVAIGLAMLVLRRAALFQVLALLVAENGIALAAVSVSGGLPVVVELGVAFDLVVLVLVAAVFHERIFRSFGTTDTAALGDLNE